MLRLVSLRYYLLFAVLISCCHGSLVASEVEFSRDIRPILSDICFQCHGPDENHREADLRFDDPEDVIADRGGYAVVVPKSRDKSELWNRISSDDVDLVMPPADHPKRLTDHQIELLGKWIDAGAEFQGHWSFVPPQRPSADEVDNDRFNRTAIDRFVFAAMQRQGLKPSPEAAREILLRRATFDLTGLPPTLQEIDDFLRDKSPKAFERVVDRLLDSPHFGERMALDWMDAARYGDSSVFHADGPRDMWVWREWVIDAFNSNMPFDQFTIEQLAGDLLPDATWKQQVATGFNRNNATTDEGGLIEEEYRVEYAVDRVKTTSMVWLGLSMECSQCHDHKYDPISQEDYYRFFAFFNQAADPGKQTRNGNQAPIVEVPDEAKRAKIPELETNLKQLREELVKIHNESVPAFEEWLSTKSKERQTSPSPANPVAHFPLDRLSGKTFTNGSNEEHEPAVIAGDESENLVQEGFILDALATGPKTFATAADVASFERDQAFSYGCWVQSPKFQGAPIARMDSDNASRGFDIHLTAKSIEAHFVHAWPDNAIKVEAKADFKPNQWHHVFVTYDGSSKAEGVQLYVDGKKQETKVVADKLTESIQTDKPFTMGRRSSSQVFTGLVDEVYVYDRVLDADEVNQLASADPVAALLTQVDQAEDYKTRLHNHFLDKHYDAYGAKSREIAATETMIANYRKPRSTVMVMKDLPEMRMTYVLNRGQYDAPDKERPVQPGVPEFLGQLDVSEGATRLDMARWIVGRKNPLTARVIVNRYWRLLMGAGIVKTVEDFGSQGEWPSHPRLLDWLAVDFMENGWDVKRLLKQIVTSATYRQSAASNALQLAKDPGNRYLSRGPRFRLQGEFIRDNALAVSELLVNVIGGPSVKPYQPPGIWNEVSLDGNLRFKPDKGDGLYRRSMYTYWKRSAPSPSMTIFDAPTREKCTVRRSTTNTPLQALVVMNDPQFIEAARFLAERIMREGESTEERIELAYRLATARKPSRKVATILMQAYESERAAFENDEERAMELLSTGEKKRDESLNAIDHAAWTIVASIILNLDETLTRG